MDMQTIRLTGEPHDTHYFRGGSGPALLYLHHLAGMQGWEPVHAELAKSFEVIAPYAPGAGPTGDGLDDFDNGLDLVLHYTQLLDALGLGAVHVVGHSLGAWVAAELAAIQPHRVNRAVLVNPLGIWDDELLGEDPYAQPPMAATGILFARPELRNSLILKDGATDMMENYIQETRDLKASAKFLWPIPETGIRRRTRFIRAQTLIVTSGLDRIVPAAYGAVWQKAIAGSSAVTVPDAGHLINLEQPERMATLAANFLKGGE